MPTDAIVEAVGQLNMETKEKMEEKSN